jgi:metal-sulfur cluster biosynthetic enzyme/ribosomal protein L22
MTALAELTDIVVRKHQIRLAEAEATAALGRVLGEPAVAARAKLRLGPVGKCEPLARVLDEALVRAQECGLDPEVLVVSAGVAEAAEDIVRVRRKAHGVADWISSPTSDVTIVLRPRGLAAVAAAAPVAAAPAAAGPAAAGPAAAGPATADPAAGPAAAVGDAAGEPRPETEAELAVREALYEVIDPDLGVNIVDLGFVRRVRLDGDGRATITMTLTSAACPLTAVMELQLRSVLAGTGTEFTVVWEWLPSWRPHDISDDGRDQLRAIGFSAF